MKKSLIAVLFIVLLTGMSCNTIAQDISKGKLLYENTLADAGKVKDWVMEGPGKIEFQKDGMHMYSPDEKGHHVFWCPVDFPSNFIAEWEAQDIEIDAGLCIVFFAAKGLKGESIFDSTLPKRTEGTFTDYTKGAMNDYHISYYANGKDHPGREFANLRKNKGFNLVLTGEMGIPLDSKAVSKVRLVKYGGHILMYIDERKIIDWLDDGVKYGKILEGGKIGFRQMQWTHFAYKNFKVWESVVPK